MVFGDRPLGWDFDIDYEAFMCYDNGVWEPALVCEEEPRFTLLRRYGNVLVDWIASEKVGWVNFHTPAGEPAFRRSSDITAREWANMEQLMRAYAGNMELVERDAYVKRWKVSVEEIRAYCTCRTKIESDDMLTCSACTEQFHPKCVGQPILGANEEYLCQNCGPMPRTVSWDETEQEHGYVYRNTLTYTSFTAAKCFCTVSVNLPEQHSGVEAFLLPPTHPAFSPGKASYGLRASQDIPEYTVIGYYAGHVVPGNLCAGTLLK